MEIGKSRLNLLVTSSSNIIASDKWNYHFLDFVEFQGTLVFLIVFNKKGFLLAICFVKPLEVPFTPQGNLSIML